MKAIVYTEYGSPEVLHLRELEKPKPKDNELLIKVYATSINYGDTIARNFRAISPQKFNMPMLFWFFARITFGLWKPHKNILGSEFAGKVEATGKDVTLFKKGDQVFGYLGQQMGTNAEYVCVPATGLVALKPANMTYEGAATLPYGGLTALNLLRKANIQPGQQVLVNGASGNIGSAAVQLARHYGAEVTGVCSTPRLEIVKSLGAKRVIDYTQEDFTQGNETYDLVFDVLGRSSFSRCKRVLKENGRYLLASFKGKQLLQMVWTARTGGKKVICALSSENLKDLILLKELAEAGVIKSVVDKSYPPEQAAEAHRYVENGYKKGHVVITMAQDDASQ